MPVGRCEGPFWVPRGQWCFSRRLLRTLPGAGRRPGPPHSRPRISRVPRAPARASRRAAAGQTLGGLGDQNAVYDSCGFRRIGEEDDARHESVRRLSQEFAGFLCVEMMKGVEVKVRWLGGVSTVGVRGER